MEGKKLVKFVWKGKEVQVGGEFSRRIFFPADVNTYRGYVPEDCGTDVVVDVEAYLYVNEYNNAREPFQVLIETTTPGKVSYRKETATPVYEEAKQD